MHEQPRVLVVEDDASLLALISTWLEQHGSEVARAATGSDLVLSPLEQGSFDLVITDIGIRWMDGLEAMRSVRHATVLNRSLALVAFGVTLTVSSGVRATVAGTVDGRRASAIQHGQPGHAPSRGAFVRVAAARQRRHRRRAGRPGEQHAARAAA